MFRDADPLGEAGEVSDGARVLEWAEGRPVVAVSLVVACWMIVVFAIASVYGMLL